MPSEVPQPDPGDKGNYAEYVVYKRLKDFSESLGLNLYCFVGVPMLEENVKIRVTYLKKLTLLSSSQTKNYSKLLCLR